MRIAVFILAGCVLLAAVASARAAEPEAKAEHIRFSESFEDADLAQRGWYDAPSVRSNLTAVMGRVAGYQHGEVTWKQLLASSERLEPSFKGLKD